MDKMYLRAVQDFNKFAAREMAKPDFSEVKQFAINGYYLLRSAAERYGIAVAYASIERNTATTTEIELIKRYFKAARRAYYRQKARAKKCA